MATTTGRGIDFEHRFKTSRWAEDILLTELNKQPDWIVVRFGLSEVKQGDVLAEHKKTGEKEPDLLVLVRNDLTAGQVALINKINLEGADRVALFKSGDLSFLLEKAFVSIEVEFSPYKSRSMKGRNWQRKTREQWDKRPLKHANPPVAPNIFIKEEDLGPLMNWQKRNKIQVVVTHLFDQEAFAISLDEVNKFEESYASLNETDRRCLQLTSGIFKKIQSYDRIDAQGAGEKKAVYCVSPSASVKAAEVNGVKVQAQLGLSSSQKYVSNVIFSGGELLFCQEYLDLLGRNI